MPPLMGELRGGIGLAPRAVRPDDAPTKRPHQVGIRWKGWARVLMSVGGSCPQIAEEAHADDGDDRHDEEFHGWSFLGPGAMTIDDSHHPSAVAGAYT